MRLILTNIACLDVIYDPDLLKPLVQTFELLVSKSPKCRILIAGQERDPETLREFLKIVGGFFT